MRKIILLSIGLIFMLSGCTKHVDELSDNQSIIETSLSFPIEFLELDIEDYELMKAEVLLFNNSPSEFEYEEIMITINTKDIILDIFNDLGSQEYSTSVIYGERPELILYYELGNTKLDISFYGDLMNNETYRSISIMLSNDVKTESKIIEGYFNVQIKSIYDNIKN